MQAISRKGMACTIHDAFGNLVSVDVSGRRYFFANTHTPLNRGSIDKISHDKGFFYEVLKDSIRTPRTEMFLDPDAPREYDGYKKFVDRESIVTYISCTFSLPVIVKMNSGSLGRNVFSCVSETEIENALQAIFDKHSPLYDFVALVQERISIKREYRIIVLDTRVILAYEKDFSDARAGGNLSPFHMEGTHAVLIRDAGTIQRFEEFLAPVYTAFPVVFTGADIIEDESGDLYLLELNDHPGFSYCIRDNGEEPVIEMYEKILSYLDTNI